VCTGAAKGTPDHAEALTACTTTARLLVALALPACAAFHMFLRGTPGPENALQCLMLLLLHCAACRCWANIAATRVHLHYGRYNYVLIAKCDTLMQREPDHARSIVAV
jgi:hypothetical protein